MLNYYLIAMRNKYDRHEVTANSVANETVTKKSGRRKWWIVLAILVCLALIGGAVAWKTGVLLDKVSGGNASLFKSLVKNLPGVEKKLQGEEGGRVNIVLLGMRGEGVVGGGLLADTIMVLSIRPKQNDQETTRASLISIPRDLYVKVPQRDEHRKINAIYALGEERKPGSGGMEDMRTVIGEVSGLDIPYAVTINFQGFKDLVNAIGGVKINLEQPFEESLQFREAKVCDPYVFTVPTNPPQYEYKYHTRLQGTRYIAKAYPLCYNPNVECNGNFKLPAGENVLDGDTALCFARSRKTSNDFERAKRQHLVIDAIKKQALSAGTLTSFDKVIGMMDSLGNNVRTNLEAWEMQRLFDIFVTGGDVRPESRVLDTTEQGLLYHPEKNDPSAGYILLPRGDNYDQIKALFQALP